MLLSLIPGKIRMAIQMTRQITPIHILHAKRKLNIAIKINIINPSITDKPMDIAVKNLLIMV